MANRDYFRTVRDTLVGVPHCQRCDDCEYISNTVMINDDDANYVKCPINEMRSVNTDSEFVRQGDITDPESCLPGILKLIFT